LGTATSFSKFCQLIKVIRRKRKPPIRVPQKQLVFIGVDNQLFASQVP
jgi:hypothetical protein